MIKKQKKTTTIDTITTIDYSHYKNHIHYSLHLKAQKKEYRCTPTFVNLKSNTMKNTVQR